MAIAKDIIPRGARIPVKTRTAAKGKKSTPKGISRHSKQAMNAFFFQGRVAMDRCMFDAGMRFLFVTTHYALVSLRRKLDTLLPADVNQDPQSNPSR